LFVYDLNAAPIFRNRISADPIFLAVADEKTGGLIAITGRTGNVLRATVNEQDLVAYVSQNVKNPELAMQLAKRGNLPGAESLVGESFNALFASGKYKEAADVAADSPKGILRTTATMDRFKGLPQQPGQPAPLLTYLGTLLNKTKLNKVEAFELAKLVMSQNKVALLKTWLEQDKIECSEELGNLLREVDPETAQAIYQKAGSVGQVVVAMAAKGQFDEMVKYAEEQNFTPDYMFMLQSLMMSSPANAVNLAKRISGLPNPPIDTAAMSELFFQRQMVKEGTAFLLHVLKPNLEKDGMLQTKVLEVNLVAGFSNVADAVLNNKMFSYYDKPKIAQLCEKAGLYMRALEHYSDLSDVKRVVVNTHSIQPEQLVEYFGTLSAEWALECLKEMLNANMQQNLELVVRICKEYTENIGVTNIVEMLESFQSYQALFFYLGSFVYSNEDPDIHYKYIEAAAKINKIEEVERITRETSVFNPERVKNFLMETKLRDARPLINVCDRFGFVPDLTKFLYSNNMVRYIEAYVQKVNPHNAPFVVGALIDAECDTEFITNLILSVRSLIPVEPLVEEVEKRNRLKMLNPFLEHLVNEGCQDPAVHNAIGKIIIDANTNPEHFLTTNPHYESLVVGKYCEKRDPNLACIAYKRGQCDEALVKVTSDNSLFKVQARYVVERMDMTLWKTVLSEENSNRRNLIDQVVSTALPESKNPEQVSIAVKAFMECDLPNELIELLEKIVIQTGAFANNPNLQNLLIITAIKGGSPRVMDYITQLDNYDGPEVGEICIQKGMFQEAFVIYKKFDMQTQAIKCLLSEATVDMDAVHEFAVTVDLPEVWSELGHAQLQSGNVDNAISSYIRSNDTSKHAEVISAAREQGKYDDMVKYLQMVRKKVKETSVDTELVYAFAKSAQLPSLEEFITGPNSANLQDVGQRLFNEEMYEGAKIIFSTTSMWGQLASTLVKLNQFQAAVDSARKANKPQTWKEVCYACVEKEEFKLAQLCGLCIIIQADDLEELSQFYQQRGFFNELIAVMESGLGVERAHMGIFTELGILYAKYKAEKLNEHLELYSNRMNIPRLIKVCEEHDHWKELAFLYCQYDEYDNAADVMMLHVVAWSHTKLKEIATKVSNVDILYRAVTFYLEKHPDLLNDYLTVVTSRIDAPRVVDILRTANQLPLIKAFLLTVQKSNLPAVNEAINELAISEEDHEGLKASIELYDNFNQIKLAQQLEKHELMGLRKVSSIIYTKNQRWSQALEILKKDELFQDAMQTCAESGDKDLTKELLEYFVSKNDAECFGACLYVCYDLINPSDAMCLAWKNKMTDVAVPFFLKSYDDIHSQLGLLMTERKEAQVKEKEQQENSQQNEEQANMQTYLALPATAGQGVLPQQMQQQQMMQQQQQFQGQQMGFQ